MNILKRKKIIDFAINIYSIEDKMDIILDFLIDNNIKIQELLNQIAPIMDWYELSDLERMCVNELFDFIYNKINIK